MDKNLRTLVDREEIRIVLDRYSHAVDRPQISLYDDIFTEDIRATYNYNEIDGRAALKAYFSQSGATHPVTIDLLLNRTHFNGNIAIDIDGDAAQTTTYLLAILVMGGAEPKVLVRGNKYYDAWRRMPEGWRISRRRQVTEWMFEQPGIVDPDRREAA
jgi:hypothetical protein